MGAEDEEVVGEVEAEEDVGVREPPVEEGDVGGVLEVEEEGVAGFEGGDPFGGEGAGWVLQGEGDGDADGLGRGGDAIEVVALAGVEGALGGEPISLAV